MSDTTQLDTQLLGLGQIIAANRHSVPIYQRSYAWKESHVGELFEDLATAIYDHENEYFMGSIVLTAAESDEPDVVDGQQRLATTIILIAAIRDYFSQNEYSDKAEEVGRKYLATRDLRTDDLVPRLKLNSVDNNYFVDRIIAPVEERSENNAILESHRRINRAGELAKERVDLIARSAGSRAVDALIDWVEFIHRKAKVIRVSVPSHANAFIIFETLNDRGLALALSDLLKNFLFSGADDRWPEVQANWIAMGSILESVGGDEIVVDYIRHLWSSTYGLVRERQLYKEIRRRTTTKTRCVNFTADLESRAKTYCALLNSGHPYWRPYGDVARRYIAAIQTLQVREIRPLLLAVVTHFSMPQTIKALRLLVSCIVRSLVVTGRGGVLESQYSAAAKGISDGKIKTERHLRDRMKDGVPSDEEFRQSFAFASSSNSQRVRYFLREIERYLNVEKPEWVPSESVDDVSLEHILPRTLTGDWTNFDDETHRSDVHRIGNLAVLASSDNSELGNSAFKDKKKTLRKSSFLMTSIVASFDEWSRDEINERQQLLAEHAVNTWPLSGEQRQPYRKTSRKKAQSSKKRSAKKSKKRKR